MGGKKPHAVHDEKELVTVAETVTSSFPDTITEEGDVKDDKKKKKKEAPPPPEHPPVGLLQLWRFASTKEICIVYLGVIMSIILGALQPIQILIFGNLVSGLGSADNILDALLPTIKAIVGIGAGMLVAGYIAQASWVLSAEYQTKRIRMLYLHSILRQDMGWFDKGGQGSLNTRLAADTQLIEDAIGEKAGVTIQNTAQFIAGLVVAFVKGWRLALVILACLPVMAIFGGIMMIFLTKWMTGGQTAYAEAGAIAEQALGSIKTVYAFSLQDRFQKKYEVYLEKAKQNGIKGGFILGMGFGAFMFILFASYGLAFWYGSKLVREGTDGMDGGRVLTVFMALVIGAMGTMQMAPNLSAFSTGRAAAGQVFATIDRVPPIDTDNEEGVRPEKVEGAISFQDVKFHYPTRPDIPILKGLNLDIKPGTTVAFVGPSGSGKSTSIALTQRFYDPVEGAVILDGTNIKDLDVKWLRRQIGIVSQEPVLFNMSIRDNLLQGLVDRTASEEEVVEACKKANCHNFIMQLPKQYDTLVGDHGGMLSGGQKQRIAIARALLKNPRILLLDEATSALDTASERLVQKALDIAAKDRTTIVIAHRLSTIRNADLIVVREKGDLVEKGTHDELYALGGVYTKLVDKQKIKMQEDPSAAHIEAEMDDSELEEVLLKENEEIAAKMVVNNGAETIITMEGVERVKSARQLKEEEREKKLRGKAPLFRVLGMMKSDYLLLFFGVLGALGAGAVFPAYGLVFSKVVSMLSITRNLTDEAFSGPNLYAFLFVVIGLGALVTIFVQIAAFELAGARLTKKIRSMTFAALLRQEAGFFDLEGNSMGALTTVLATDAAGVGDMVTKTWGDLVQLVSSSITGLLISFIYSWRLSLVILAAMPFTLGAAALQARAHQGFEDKTKKAYSQSGEVASEAIKEIRTVKSLTREKYWEDRYYQSIKVPHHLALKKGYIASLGHGAQMGFSAWASALGFYAGIRFTLAGLANFEDILVVLLVLLITAQTMGRTSLFVSKFVKGKHCAINTFEYLDRKTLIDPDNQADDIGDITGDIELENIAFTYPARPDIPIFNGKFGFKAGQRQTVALVGPSGCGKSTSIGLLERWYDPSGGAVKVDGKDVRSVQLKSLRRDMALVGQEPVLFDMTIRENLLYGSDREDVTQEELEEAAKMANIHTFVSELPQGYHTRVGDKGSQLSGGQKQRIAIARALVRKPKILLLDEATSALDSESEKLVQQALDNAAQGRTTITIAHRLSTIQGADLICVCKDGKVVEQGKHFDLIALNGVYKELVDQQDLNALS